jgi:hypothetical protein
VKVKNLKAPAVTREAEEDWGRKYGKSVVVRARMSFDFL